MVFIFLKLIDEMFIKQWSSYFLVVNGIVPFHKHVLVAVVK